MNTLTTSARQSKRKEQALNMPIAEERTLTLIHPHLEGRT